MHDREYLQHTVRTDMETRLEWSTEPPTEPGWYFWREDKHRKPYPVQLSGPPPERIYGEWLPVELQALAGIKEPESD